MLHPASPAIKPASGPCVDSSASAGHLAAALRDLDAWRLANLPGLSLDAVAAMAIKAFQGLDNEAVDAAIARLARGED